MRGPFHVLRRPQPRRIAASVCPARSLRVAWNMERIDRTSHTYGSGSSLQIRVEGPGPLPHRLR